MTKDFCAAPPPPQKRKMRRRWGGSWDSCSRDVFFVVLDTYRIGSFDMRSFQRSFDVSKRVLPSIVPLAFPYFLWRKNDIAYRYHSDFFTGLDSPIVRFHLFFLYRHGVELDFRSTSIWAVLLFRNRLLFDIDLFFLSMSCPTRSSRDIDFVFRVSTSCREPYYRGISMWCFVCRIETDYYRSISIWVFVCRFRLSISYRNR